MPTVYEGVLADLGPRIVDGTIPEGTLLTLEQVGQRFDVSRTVAREVVQVLVSMGLVESRRRTGVRVRPRLDWDVFDPAVIRWKLAGSARREHLAELTQLRAAVEPSAAALAAENADADQRAEVQRLAEAMEVAGASRDLQAFLEHDIAFHRLLLTASGNGMFAGLGDVVEEVLRGRTDHHLMPHEPKPEARHQHATVARAVARGDADLAREAMSAICQEVVRGIAEVDDPDGPA